MQMSEPSVQQLAELGQAVLDEHRSAVLAEQDLTDPERQADAKANAAFVQELLEDLIRPAPEAPDAG